MDKIPEIESLNSAWTSGEIKFQELNVGANVRYASYDGSYICLSTAPSNGYLIFDSDLKECASFYIADKLEVPAHVFTKSRGLVRGGNNGQITITTFDEWKPNPTTRVDQCLEGKITCLSTRDGLIIAGSDADQVGGWSYDGTQLYRFQIPGYSRFDGIDMISLRRDSFLVKQADFIFKYKASTCDAREAPIHLGHHQVPVFPAWATYDIVGDQIIYPPDRRSHTFRPIVPISAGQHKTFVLSVPDKSDEIIISDFNTREIIRNAKVDRKFLGHVAYMLCNYEQLFLIGKDTVHMMDFGKDLIGYSKGQPFEVAECFALMREIRDE